MPLALGPTPRGASCPGGVAGTRAPEREHRAQERPATAGQATTGAAHAYRCVTIEDP
jgi:hypothetical protein